MDPTAEDLELGRRLEAYADARLSPSLTTESRIRARVLAAAHRRADFARADAGLVLLPRPERQASGNPGTRGHHRRRAASALIAASLAASLFLGTALAAQPGGTLYEVRLWAETMTLPSEPSARAVAELDRLADRLAEADAAGRAGDMPGASAALDAYESILAIATSEAVEAGDVVAAAALEAGVARNIEV
ncbi:MAG: hypothetical protein OEV61_07760, partial [Chloroflexota bacterium]|nr:hypothetical protein [Chloroflexota bacterium]